MPAKLLTPDICVIGAGAGGLAVAGAAATFGVPTVLIEQGRMGGESLNGGSIPASALIAASRKFADLKNLAQFGITIGEPVIDYSQARAHMQKVTAAIAPNSTAERLAALGVQVISGTAQFSDSETVTVGDDFIVKARRFVIATGSVSATPLMHGLDAVHFHTSETIFDLVERPQHLIVVGAGTIGLELAQIFRRFGAAVSVVEARTPLGGEEPECVDEVMTAFTRDGIVLHAGTGVKNVAHSGTGIEVTLETAAGVETLAGSHLLLAAGRRPNIEALNLQAAGIRFDANGITVNQSLRSSNKRVYAIGDVTGGPRFTHAAQHHAALVARNALFRTSAKVNDNAIPQVTFTDPELARVGMTEAEVRKTKYRKFRILRGSYQGNDRAQAEGDTHGQIKAIVDKDGQILGVTIVGRQASELIAPWALAIAQNLNISAMAELIAPYPTRTEIGKRAATAFSTPKVTGSFLRRLISWLRFWE